MSNEPTVNPAEQLDYEVELPPLPHTLVRTARLVGEEAPEDPISELKSIVASDPVVAARTLRRVNSVYYGLKRQVGNVEQAIVLLGFEKVYHLILTNSLVKLEDLFSTDSQVGIFQHVITRCIATASATHRLGQELYLPGAHLAYSAGLLHAIGRIILLYNRPAPYSSLWWENGEIREPEPAVESRRFGASYSELSAHAASKWELPETLSLSIRFHLRPGRLGNDRVVRGLARAIAAGRALAETEILQDESDEGRREEASDPDSPLARLADENDTSVSELARAVRRDADRIREFVRMSLSSPSAG